MDNQILALLDSGAPEDRKEAIKLLAQQQDAEALQYLAALYKTDPDPEVRELAVKAGRYIRKQQETAKWTGQGRPDVGDLGEGKRKRDNESEYNVSPKAEERARSLLDTAMDYHMQGDSVRAIKTARQAFHLNPNLQHDKFAAGLAGEILNMPSDEAIDELLYSDTGKEKRKRGGDDGVSWESALLDLALYGLVVGVLAFVGVMAMSRFFTDIFVEAMNEAARMDPEITRQMSMAEIEQFARLMEAGSVLQAVLNSILTAVFSVIGLVILYAIYHFCATTLLGGDGTFRGLIHKLTNFTAAFTLLSTLAIYVFVYFMFRDMAALIQPELTEQQMTEWWLIQWQQTISLFAVVSLLASLAAIFWYSKLIGENYRFGTGKGCLTIIASYIVMALVVGMCFCAASALMAEFFNSMMVSASTLPALMPLF